MMRAQLYLASLALPLTLASCASAPGAYQSLAKLDAERVSGTAKPAPPDTAPAPPPPVAPDLEARIAQLRAQALQAHRDFEARTESTGRTVAAAAGTQPPADRWIEAQVALAGLQALRSNAVIALAELDRLHADERLAEPQAETPSARAIAAARAEIDAWVVSQDSVIARLVAQLPG